MPTVDIPLWEMQPPRPGHRTVDELDPLILNSGLGDTTPIRVIRHPTPTITLPVVARSPKYIVDSHSNHIGCEHNGYRIAITLVQEPELPQRNEDGRVLTCFLTSYPTPSSEVDPELVGSWGLFEFWNQGYIKLLRLPSKFHLPVSSDGYLDIMRN